MAKNMRQRVPRKIVITLVDKDIDAGKLTMTVDFDPPMTADCLETPAARLALKMLQLAQRNARKARDGAGR